MPRNRQPDPSPEAEAALERATSLARLIAALLAGDPEPTDGAEPASALAAAFAMAMVYYLIRLDPDDVAALHIGPGSLADFRRGPLPPSGRGRAPLAALVYGLP